VGCDWVGSPRRYRAATRVLQATDGTERSRQATPDDRPAIADVYRRFASRYRGMTDRTEKQWNTVLDDKADTYTYTYVYEGDAGIEGYLTYNGGSHESTDLREFLCLTAGAQRGLLGLLGRLDMQTRAVVWSAPADDLLWSLVVDHENETRLWVTTQARVVDVQSAISSWRPERHVRGAFVLGIADASADWNTGNWRVEFADGRISAARTDCDPQIAMDIRAFSQAFFGTLDVATIRRAERMTVSDESGYEAFRACLAGPPMWINDSF